MLLPGTQMHLVTFAFACVELVILFYLLIYKVARPDDNKAQLNIVLVCLLLIYNITGGLLPDPKLPGSVFLQEAIAYGTGFITPSYFPYYVYKAFGLVKMRFHAYRGILFCLILPYILFVIVYGVSGNLNIAKTLLILPVLYAIWVIVSLVKFESRESKEEFAGLLLGLSPWVGLPIIDFFDLGQAVEASVTNSGFLLLLSLQVKNHISTLRKEHERIVLSEKQLLNWNNSLKEEVEKRTSEIKSIIEERTNTLVNLAHETKTPLTLIDNYLEEYIKKNGEKPELAIVKRSLGKITTDISNIFDLERLNRGMSLYNHNQPANFTDLINDSLILFGVYAQKAGIKLTASIETDAYVRADPFAVNRIVMNLVENAIKFSEEGGSVDISLYTDQDKIVFSVTDSGVGIPPEVQRKIFEPYYQFNNKKSSTQGMGLGLPIVKKVLRELNGEIYVESDPRKKRGTKITVKLKRQIIPRKEEITKTTFVDTKVKDIGIERLNLVRVDHDENKKTILIVEDNISMVNYLQKKLVEKYNVVVALNGRDALRILQTHKNSLDLILSDIMMDKVDGFAFLKTVSENPENSHIPFLFLSAKSTTADKLYGLKLGAIDFVQKPFSMQELTQKIESIILHEERRKAAILSMALDHLTSNLSSNRDIPFNPGDKFEGNCDLYQLTERERAIARLICEGFRYKEIGQKLFIAERTVAKHVQNIFEKVEVSNKIELINKLAS